MALAGTRLGPDEILTPHGNEEAGATRQETSP